MLLRFLAGNHRSIMSPVELSMIAVDRDRPGVREFDGLNEPVLSVAGIYGANASGKSNVLDAMAWLAGAVRDSLRSWEQVVPRDPFRFSSGPQDPSHFEIEMIIDGVRYAYELDVSATEVVHEALFSYPQGRRRTLFTREFMEFKGRRGSGLGAGTEELLTPTTLALSAAVRLGHDEVAALGRAIAGASFLDTTTRRRPWGVPDSTAISRSASTARPFLDDESWQTGSNQPDQTLVRRRESVLALLRFADLGISNVTVTSKPPDSVMAAISQAHSDVPGRRLQFLHRGSGEELPFEFADESDGTRTWFGLIGPALAALDGGLLLLMDEIDASLHPQLSARLIGLFQDPAANPHGAQLIFTSHDASLLNHLNRDEAWFTEKHEDGQTTLVGLAEFGGDKVRRSLNLERAYLQGRFGGLPELELGELQRAIQIYTDGR